MSTIKSYRSLRLLSVWSFIVLLLSACGGGGGGSSPTSSSGKSSSGKFSSSAINFSSSSIGNSSAASSIAGDFVISGTVTYDFVPSSSNGLNYAASEARPVRGAVVELLGSTGNILTSSTTNDEGFYSLAVAKNTMVRVRAKAELRRTSAPTWEMRVTDNTNNNNLYVLDGGLVDSGNSNSQRNLHAPSGWGGSTYTAVRAAAPFAILDSIYVGLQRFMEAANPTNFPPLDLRWSVNNIGATNPDDDFTTGEIGTSFFFGDAIYIIGEANADTDEYDRHVILHEWGHYIEAALSRADSIGGEHASGDLLDMRVAFSEGFGNAFSAMMLDDPLYRDSIGFRQGTSFSFDVGEKNRPNKGWYSEASVESVLYNYYVSSNNKTTRDFLPVLQTLTSPQFYSADSMSTIFLFAERLLALFPSHTDVFESLLEEQDINSANQYGVGETNNGGYTNSLPIYKTLSANGPKVNICSASPFGKYNKLGVSQFLHFQINQSGNYLVKVERAGDDQIATDPDFIIYRQGKNIADGVMETSDIETRRVDLNVGIFVMEVYDWNNFDPAGQSVDPTCFDVSVEQ